MDERIKDIIKLRESELELALCIKDSLDKKTVEDRNSIISSILTNIENNVRITAFNEEFVCYELPCSNLQDYIIRFSTDSKKFKETLSEYIDLTEVSFTDEFIRTLLQSKVISGIYSYNDHTNGYTKMIFSFDDLKEMLKSLTIDLHYNQEQHSLIATMKIPSLTEYKTRKLSL